MTSMDDSGLENFLRDYDKSSAQALREAERKRFNPANDIYSKSKGLSAFMHFNQIIPNVPRLEAIQQERTSPTYTLFLDEVMQHVSSGNSLSSYSTEVDITKEFVLREGYVFLPEDSDILFSENSFLKEIPGYLDVAKKFSRRKRIFAINPEESINYKDGEVDFDLELCTTLGHELFCVTDGLRHVTYMKDHHDNNKIYFTNGENRVFIAYDDDLKIRKLGRLALNSDSREPELVDKYGPLFVGNKLDINFSDIMVDYGTLNPLEPTLEIGRHEGDYFVRPAKQDYMTPKKILVSHSGEDRRATYDNPAQLRDGDTLLVDDGSKLAFKFYLGNLDNISYESLEQKDDLENVSHGSTTIQMLRNFTQIFRKS